MTNILYELLSDGHQLVFVIQIVVILVLLIVREPKSYQNKAHNLRNETFDITITMACFLIKTDIFICNFFNTRIWIVACVEKYLRFVLFCLLLWFVLSTNNFVDYLCYWRIFDVDDIETCQMMLVCHFKGGK